MLRQWIGRFEPRDFNNPFSEVEYVTILIICISRIKDGILCRYYVTNAKNHSVSGYLDFIITISELIISLS